MEPIVPISEAPDKARIRGTLADKLAACLAALAALMAFGYSVLFFMRFLENDTHIWGIVSAFLLCFGVGAFAYIPAAIIARLGWKAYKEGANRKALLWSIVLLLPWLVLSLLLVFISDLPLIYSLPLLIAVIILMAWALISLRNFKS